MARFWGTVGILLVPQLKNLVSRLKFQGHEADLWLSSHWLVKDFEVKGDNETIQAVMNWCHAATTSQKRGGAEK